MSATSTLETTLRELEERRDEVEVRYRAAVTAADRERAEGLAAIALTMLGERGEGGVLRASLGAGAAAAPVPARDVPAPPRGRRQVPAPAAPPADSAPSTLESLGDPWGDIDKAPAARPAPKKPAPTGPAARPAPRTPRRSRGGSAR